MNAHSMAVKITAALVLILSLAMLGALASLVYAEITRKPFQDPMYMVATMILVLAIPLAEVVFWELSSRWAFFSEANGRGS